MEKKIRRYRIFRCGDSVESDFFVAQNAKNVSKMRSAQIHRCIWAIMKKFIYMCNEKHYAYSLVEDVLSITICYE